MWRSTICATPARAFICHCVSGIGVAGDVALVVADRVRATLGGRSRRDDLQTILWQAFA